MLGDSKMSLKNLQSKSAAALDGISTDTQKAANVDRPTTSPGVTMLAANMAAEEINKHAERSKAAEEKAIAAEARLSEIEEQLKDSPNEVPVDLIKIIDERRRKLSPEQFNELKDNLEKNPLVHPIAVKRLIGDLKYGYELISGHNRLDVYRILGRATIPVSVIDIEDNDTAERSAFFANLLQPALPDFERFIGFKKWQERTGDTQAEMSIRSGIPKTTLSKLMSFSALPEGAFALIKDKPREIGFDCVYKLSILSKDVDESRIIETVRRVLEGEITQAEAINFAKQKEPKLREQKHKDQIVRVTVKAGRYDYCSYVSKGSSLKIDFKDPQKCLIAEEQIKKVLENLAGNYE
jgi:ParB family chromosome partitioning protein